MVRRQTCTFTTFVGDMPDRSDMSDLFLFSRCIELKAVCSVRTFPLQNDLNELKNITSAHIRGQGQGQM